MDGGRPASKALTRTKTHCWGIYNLIRREVKQPKVVLLGFFFRELLRQQVERVLLDAVQRFNR